MKKNKSILKSFIISFCYVGFSTIAIFSMYPKDIFSYLLPGDWSVISIALTLPVSIFGGAYRYADSDNLFPVFIIQFIVFLLFWLVVNYIVKKIVKR